MKIFFDVDGVLIDGWHVNPDLRKPWNVNIEADLGVNLAEFERLFFKTRHNDTGSLMDSCLIGEQDLKDALAQVLPRLGYVGGVDEFVNYWFERDSNVSVEVQKAVKQLGSNSELELFIATGQEHHRAAFLWQNLRFSGYFKEMFYSADLGYLKNDLRFFTLINQRLKISLQEKPIFFDDREDVVALARQAGWDSIVFNSVDDIVAHPRLMPYLKPRNNLGIT